MEGQQLKHVKAVKIIDPRMKINKERLQAVPIGPVQSSYYPVSADSSLSATTVNFTYKTPGTGYIIDRRALVKYQIAVSITGTGNPLTAYGSGDSLRFMPINATCTSAQFTINDATLSTVPYQWLDGLSRYMYLEDLRLGVSSSPSTPDLTYAYTNAAGPKNVMGNYSDNSIASPDLRGALVPISMTEGNNASSFVFEIIEPIMLPPLNYQDKDLSGFIGVQSLSLILNHDWSGGNFWSHVNGNTLSTFAVTMNAVPELLLSILTPNREVEPYDMRRVYSYDCPQINYQVTPGATVVSGASTTLVSSNIDYNVIPSRIYCYCRRVKTGRTSTQTDTFAQIAGVSVNIFNKPGLLSSADPSELYQLCRKNGYQYSYNAWVEQQGGVLCLKPGEDLSLDDNQAPGLLTNCTFQINMNIVNQTGASINYELVVVGVLPGAIYFQNSSAERRIGLLSPMDIYNAAEAPGSAPGYYNFNVFGGGFFDDVWSGIKKVGRVAANVAPAAVSLLAPELAPFANAASGVANQLLGGRMPRHRLMDMRDGGVLLGGSGEMDGYEVLGGRAPRRAPARRAPAKRVSAKKVAPKRKAHAKRVSRKARGGCGDCDDVNNSSKADLFEHFRNMDDEYDY